MNQLVSYAQKTGLKLTKPQINLLNKLEDTYGLSLLNPEDTSLVPVVNRFTGVSAQVNPLVALLVSFVYGCNTGFGPVTYRGKKVSISDFDRAKYIILALDGNAYSIAID